MGLRFGTAALVILPFTWRALKGLTKTEMRAGFLVGLSIATGYVLQTMGLQTIPSSKSAFITALYVPLVPILQWLVLRRPRSEEHTSELQSLMRISYAVFCLKKKN